MLATDRMPVISAASPKSAAGRIRLPSPPYGAYTDYVSARFSAFALLAALVYRRRTGKGQYIEQSQFETSIAYSLPPLSWTTRLTENYEAETETGLPTASPHGVFQCQGDDRWIAISRP